ncbi:31464_t:CDS:1, partial [Racocetra persica]
QHNKDAQYTTKQASAKNSLCKLAYEVNMERFSRDEFKRSNFHKKKNV